MKKGFHLLMSLMVVLSLVACSNGNNQSKSSNTNRQAKSTNESSDKGSTTNREDLSLKVSRDEKKTIVISVMGNTPFLKWPRRNLKKSTRI
ncbi:hypothetical protein E2R56_10745 [Rhodococcus qingshengii]|nr:hypothetical protein E2R56_10745 [Rhodococcus qingshengii]